ncbi:MAG: DUF2190 family protein [Blautia sp.]|nr:DUF2190 family protein [Blautia sp.]
MAKANYWQQGESLDYNNGSGAKIDANTILELGDVIGIAGTDIEDGETGSIHVKGVFELPKITGAINQGQKVYWYKSSVDANSGITTTAGSNTPAGYAAQAALSADTKVLVNLNA